MISRTNRPLVNRRDSEAGRKTIIGMLRTHLIMDMAQIRDVMKKWQYYEREITGMNRSIEMFCEYYNYQDNLLRLVSSKTSQKLFVKDRLEKLFVADLKLLLDVISRVPAYRDEFDAIMLRISFCRLTGDLNTGTKAVDSLIKIHSSNPKTWITAGKWFLHSDNPKIAIHVLQQGLKVFNNPVDTDIYEYLLSLEIDSALGKYTSETISDQHLEERQNKLLVTLNVYMDDFSDREWQDSKFMIFVLDMLDGYSFTKPIQERLCDILLEKFGGSSGKIWQLLVKRALKNADRVQAYNRGKELYQTGLDKLAGNLEECRWLWRQNLDFLIEVDCKMLSSTNIENQKIFREYLLDGFKDAADRQMLTDKQYVKWLEYAFDRVSEDNILERGLKEFPSSVELRVTALNRDLWADSPDTEKTFQTAIEACGDNALLLWTARLRYMYVKCTIEETQAMYKRAIDAKQVPNIIVDNLKPRYIEWLGRTMSPDVALREYAKMWDKEPYCKRLHKVALSLLAYCNSKSKHIPEIYRRLCSQFSKDNDVYYDFICYYEQLAAMPVEERREAMEHIFEEARSALDEDAFSALDIQYSEVKEKELLWVEPQS